jgi:hypothetical protein
VVSCAFFHRTAFHLSMPHCSQEPQIPTFYSLFSGSNYPLLDVLRDLPNLSQTVAALATSNTSALASQALDPISGNVLPPPGFEFKYAAHSQQPQKEPQEEKQPLNSVCPVAVEALPLRILPSRAPSPCLLPDRTPTPSSATSSASSSAASSRSHSRHGSFSSDRASPLLSSTKPTIRLLTAPSVVLTPLLSPSPTALAHSQAMPQLSIRELAAPVPLRQQRGQHGNRRSQPQRRGRD